MGAGDLTGTLTSERLGFTLNTPDSWYDLDLEPATREQAIRERVDEQARGVPELWAQRPALRKLLLEQADTAYRSGALYCSSFSMPTEAGPVTGAITVSLVPDPEVGAVGAGLPVFDQVARGSDPLAPFTLVSTVDLPGIGPCPRAAGIEDADLGDGRLLRQVYLVAAVPSPGPGSFLLAASSPVLPLVDELIDIFDAVVSTFRVVTLPDAPVEEGPR